eukprot:3936842-Alexandrium_andersonii.AAC.1
MGGDSGGARSVETRSSWEVYKDRRRCTLPSPSARAGWPLWERRDRPPDPPPTAGAGGEAEQPG